MVQKLNWDGIDMIQDLEFLFMGKMESWSVIIYLQQECLSGAMQMGNYIYMIW